MYYDRTKGIADVITAKYTCITEAPEPTPFSFSSFPNNLSTAQRDIATSFKDSSPVALEQSNFARYYQYSMKVIMETQHECRKE